MRALLFLVLLVWILPGSAQSARPWPEANRLFDGDRTWIGGDGAYSVPLPGGRVLWLFGDTLVDPTRKGRQSGLRFVANSLGLQIGSNPARARMQFLLGSHPNGAPAAWFADTPDHRFWPGGAVAVGNRLLMFLMRVEETTGGLGFQVVGMEPALIDGLHLGPEKWRVTRMHALKVPGGITLGSAGLIAHGGYLYAYGAHPEGNPVYLARWPQQKAMTGKLDRPQWWTAQGWSYVAAPTAVLSGASTEFTVHYDPKRKRFVQVQTLGFIKADLTWREATRPEGPWSAPIVILRPKESREPGRLVYQGKAHPELSGAPLVGTYGTLVFDLKKLLLTPKRYRPHFVRIEPGSPN